MRVAFPGFGLRPHPRLPRDEAGRIWRDIRRLQESTQRRKDLTEAIASDGELDAGPKQLDQFLP